MTCKIFSCLIISRSIYDVICMAVVIINVLFHVCKLSNCIKILLKVNQVSLLFLSCHNYPKPSNLVIGFVVAVRIMVELKSPTPTNQSSTTKKSLEKSKICKDLARSWRPAVLAAPWSVLNLAASYSWEFPRGLTCRL